MRKEPADAVLVALVLAGLGADLPLLRRGYATVSSRAGATYWRRVLVLYLACHFCRLWPSRFDPLSRVGALIRKDAAWSTFTSTASPTIGRVAR